MLTITTVVTIIKQANHSHLISLSCFYNQMEIILFAVLNVSGYIFMFKPTPFFKGGGAKGERERISVRLHAPVGGSISRP